MDDILSEEEIKVLKAAEAILTSLLVRLEIKNLKKMVGREGKAYSASKIEMLATALYEIEKAREEKDSES